MLHPEHMSLTALREIAAALQQRSDVEVSHGAAGDLQALLKEIEIYQAELEQQNRELQRTQQALEAVRDKYFELFHLAPVGYLTLDSDGVVKDANLTSVMQLGCERGALIDRPLTLLIEEEQHFTLHRHLRRALGSGQRQLCELLMRRPDGSSFHAHVESILVRGALGAAPTLLTAMLDVSARKQAEQALRSSEQRYRALFQSSRDAIFLFDGVGHVTEANQAALELLGQQDMEQLRGAFRHSFYPPNCREAYESALSKHLYARKPPPLSMAVQRVGGEHVPVEVSASLVHTGPWVLTQAVFRDMSERVRAAQEKELLEERLRQSQKLEAIGRLAGGVAHDMNNVLGVIMSLASLLLEETPPEDPRHRSVAEILAASRRGRDLTQNLLTFARKGPHRRETLALNDLCTEVTEILRRTLPKSIAISLSLSEEPTAVEGDASQLHQAVMNLCLNAVDAMPDGGQLTLRTERGDDAEGGYVELTIADTGVGMDPQTLEHSFEPFYTTKPLGKGTGLGLAMVYGTVRGHGGNVTVDSAPGSGTEVTLRLPASEATPIERPKEAPPKVALSPAGQTVLVVDDEPMVRSAACRLLRRLGYTVLQAESGSECLRIYEEQGDAISLLILDLSMPEMNGAEVLRRLLQQNPAVRVLLCSGYSNETIPEDLLRAEAIGFLRKPFEMQDLAKQLKRFSGLP